MSQFKTFAFSILAFTIYAAPVHAQTHVKVARKAITENLAPEQVEKLREQIAQARYEDDLGQHQLQNDSKDMDSVLEKAQPGDILFLRSGNLMGSLAARSSDVPGQYAHFAMIAENPTTHQLVTIEADFGEGVSILTPKKSAEGRLRVGLFRNKNPEIGRLAAAKLYDYVAEKMKNGGIKYDNLLDNDDHTALTCTEVVSLAYSLIGIDNIPMYPSHLSMFDTKLKKQLGINVTTVFTPQDLEIDPRFELIQEWRDLPHLQVIYKADAIFGKLYSWAKERKLVIHRDLLSMMITPFLGSRIAKELGFSNAQQKEARNFVNYGVSIYFLLQKMESELNLALVGVDTSQFKVSDYEEVLESIGPAAIQGGAAQSF